MFNKKNFLFYLPRINKYYIIIAKDESTAVWKLCNHFNMAEDKIDGYQIIKDCKTIK